MTEQRKTRLVVMMSALNEEQSIGDVIDGIPRDPGFPAEVRVVVVDDGSDDATGDIAAGRGAVVIRHPSCMGLGRSFADALDRALREGADIIVNIDADGQFDPADIPKLVRPIVDDQADFVTTTRFAREDLVPSMPWAKKWGNRQMCRLVNLVTGTTGLTDVSCGFRAFSREAALHLNLVGAFTYTHESIIDLAAKGFRIAEVPLAVRGVRKHGESRVARNLFAYGVRAFMIVLRALCYTRPLAFFGGIATVLLTLGGLQGLFVFGHWLLTGRTAPYRSVLIGSSLFLTLGFLVGILALVADMLGRLVTISERLYTQMKQGHYDGEEDRTWTAPPGPADDDGAAGESDPT
jgi:glycosyltransferase involved in cell wall biosynthesis